MIRHLVPKWIFFQGLRCKHAGFQKKYLGRGKGGEGGAEKMLNGMRDLCPVDPPGSIPPLAHRAA